MAHLAVDGMRIEGQISSHLELALARLSEDADAARIDALDDPMFELGSSEGEVTSRFQVVDERSKLNLLELVRAGAPERQVVLRERLVRLLVSARRAAPAPLDEARARALLESATTILRSLNAQRSNAARGPDLLDLATSDPAWAALLHDRVEGGAVIPGLLRYLTTFGDGRINLNTADVLVLRAIFHTDPALAERIVARRPPAIQPSSGPAAHQVQPFRDVAELMQLDGVSEASLRSDGVDLASDLDVRSDVYSIVVDAATALQRRRVQVVVERVHGLAVGGQPPGLEGFRYLLDSTVTELLDPRLQRGR